MALYEKTAHELQELLHNKEVKAVEIFDSIIERIGQVEPKVHSYITLAEEQARAAAQKVDDKLAKGEKLPPLAGIPVAIKDNISTGGIRTTCASKILENYIPPYDAAVIEQFKANQLIIIGKTNLDEFAMGSSTENSGLFITRNPWDLEAVPGGSSGGSAAAVRADETILAVGSDTGGSIRQPASYCGIVGLKPTYGRVSRYGLVAFASSLDQIGPLTKDVTDCALFLQAIAKYDPRDSTSVDFPVPDYLQEMKKGVKGLKIGLAQEYLGEGISEPVKKVIFEAAKVFQSLGAEVVDVSLPYTEYALSTYYIIAPAEASSNLARYDGVRYGYRTGERVPDSVALFMKTRKEGFGPEVKRRIMVGTYALSSGYYDAYYLKAQKVRTLIREDFNKAFQSCDLILTPTAPSPAFKIGSKTKDPLEMYQEDICTLACNMAGIPGISIPGGFAQGMPVGIQLLGPAFKEETLLRAAYGFEQATEFHKERPTAVNS
ncbi:MAG TPA: Asp-tRNA(Asn)/Glu-tRNA(Gln) amidotransferase GatCAB subunit A [Firmicutes bacterium]|nr:Asp-tRNA(Asn)/Glu-tRNA(Gln) amidotransferase GatCAB subunit A [Bacillota bacterium]